MFTLHQIKINLPAHHHASHPSIHIATPSATHMYIWFTILFTVLVIMTATEWYRHGNSNFFKIISFTTPVLLIPAMIFTIMPFKHNAVPTITPKMIQTIPLNNEIALANPHVITSNNDKWNLITFTNDTTKKKIYLHTTKKVTLIRKTNPTIKQPKITLNAHAIDVNVIENHPDHEVYLIDGTVIVTKPTTKEEK